MQRKIKAFFEMPPDILPEFQQTALRYNRISMLVICIMIFGMELFNMARVLFWTSAKLSTLNNRIYFTLYCSLFVIAALYLILSFLLRGGHQRAELALQYSAAALMLIWHVCINIYDLTRSASAEIGIYYTAILGLSIFILMPAWYALVLFLSGWGLFIGLAGPLLSSGDQINITFTTIVSLAVALTNRHHYATVISQRMEINKMNEQLKEIAQRDALTGLLNKASFQRCVEPYLITQGAALLIFDMDNFKAVNDHHGHPCGDYVLKEFALRLEDVFPDAWALSRIGGDEFAAMIHAADEEGLLTAVRALIHSTSQITWHGQNIGASCSVGCCRASDSGGSYEQFYSKADSALYKAKEQGKNQVCLSPLS